MGLRKGDEQVIHEVLNHRDDDGVAHGVVGFVVGGGKLVGPGRSHEEGGFASGDQTGFPFSGLVEEEELATAAALGGSKAA